MSTQASSIEKATEASCIPPLLRLPAEIRQMILIPLLVVDDLLHCPSRVYGNRIIGWKGIYAIQADMMFTCRLLYHEVLQVFLEKNNFFFSAPPTKTLFPCAKYARWAKSITYQVHNAYWQEWQTYLSENNPLVVKNLKLQLVTHLSASRDHDSLIRHLISICESFIENIVVIEKANVHFSSLSHTDIRRRLVLAPFFIKATTDSMGRSPRVCAEGYDTWSTRQRTTPCSED